VAAPSKKPAFVIKVLLYLGNSSICVDLGECGGLDERGLRPRSLYHPFGYESAPRNSGTALWIPLRRTASWPTKAQILVPELMEIDS
jgi:hypothetical protein